MRDNENGLFPALEAALRTASKPMDCHELFAIPSVREHAASANRVSDYLGGLWRKGLVSRLPSPKDGESRARWIYEWKGNKGPKYLDGAVEFTPKILADRPAMLITEEGSNIILEFQNLVITIRQKTPTR